MFFISAVHKILVVAFVCQGVSEPFSANVNLSTFSNQEFVNSQLRELLRVQPYVNCAKCVP